MPKTKIVLVMQRLSRYTAATRHHTPPFYTHPRSEGVFPPHCSFSAAGNPFSRHQRKISSCPDPAASTHVRSSHGQSLALHHCSISRRPCRAASAHVRSSQGQPFVRHHCRISGLNCRVQQMVQCGQIRVLTRGGTGEWAAIIACKSQVISFCIGVQALANSIHLKHLDCCEK